MPSYDPAINSRGREAGADAAETAFGAAIQRANRLKDLQNEMEEYPKGDSLEVHQFGDSTPADLSHAGEWQRITISDAFGTDTVYLCELQMPVYWHDNEGLESCMCAPGGNYPYLLWDGGEWAGISMRFGEVILEEGDVEEVHPAKIDFPA